MCRLLGVLSTKPVDAAAWLADAPQALLRQSAVDKKRRQGDGWGAGWFEKGRPHVLKSARPMYRDPATLRRAARYARGRTLVGHVRWASNPLKLPRKQLIGLPHSQPFRHGRWLFAHNGTLYIPKEVAAELGPWARYIKGNNDSEVLFYWLMKTLVQPAARDDRWATHLRKSFKQLDAIWKRCRARYPIYKYPYHGVNWILTNGELMLAFCFVDPRGFDQGRALCHRGQPYYQLQVQLKSDRMIIASEPLTLEKDWQPVKHGELLIARRGSHGVTLHRQKGM